MIVTEQALRKNCIKIDSNRYQLSFFIENKLYKLIIKPIRGPLPSVQVVDNNEIDITATVLSFVNGYKSVQRPTPIKMGYNVLTIYENDGDSMLSLHDEEDLPIPL